MYFLGINELGGGDATISQRAGAYYLGTDPAAGPEFIDRYPLTRYVKEFSSAAEAEKWVEDSLLDE